MTGRRAPHWAVHSSVVCGGEAKGRLRQVEGHRQEVVAESAVLLGVEDLEQRGRRVSAEVATELVDLVEQDHWIVDLPVSAQKGRGVFFEVDGVFFEVKVFILKSMFWRAAQNSAKMRAGARASRARQRGFVKGFVQPSRTSTSESKP